MLSPLLLIGSFDRCHHSLFQCFSNFHRVKNAQIETLSVSLPTPPPSRRFNGYRCVALLISPVTYPRSHVTRVELLGATLSNFRKGGVPSLCSKDRSDMFFLLPDKALVLSLSGVRPFLLSRLSDLSLHCLLFTFTLSSLFIVSL